VENAAPFCADPGEGGPSDEDFEKLQWLLEQFPNPHRKKGRLWLIV
jgi:hypothetical protein